MKHCPKAALHSRSDAQDAYPELRGNRSLRVIFFFNDTATTEIYTLSLHDALPISPRAFDMLIFASGMSGRFLTSQPRRSEEHTSELQSRLHLVCRLLLEKKKQSSQWYWSHCTRLIRAMARR